MGLHCCAGSDVQIWPNTYRKPSCMLAHRGQDSFLLQDKLGKCVLRLHEDQLEEGTHPRGV